MKPKKHTVITTTISYTGLAYILEHGKTKKELFEIAKSVGASCDALKRYTAFNIARELIKPESKTSITISYVL